MTESTECNKCQFLLPYQLPIFNIDLTPIKDTILKTAMEAIDEMRITHPESTKSNIQSVYMSPYKSHLENPKFGPLCDFVVDTATKLYNELYQCNIESVNLKLHVTDCWGAIYETTDHTIRHNHYPADYSCCVYLHADDNCAPIIFESKYSVQPRSNSMLIFPGFIFHEVPKTEGKRIIVAMNLFKRATFV
jgi:hypothetical protein